MPIRNIERLPWTPKVRQKDIDQFLDATRNKFIGFTLPEDHQSLAGLPQPIHEGFKTLNQVNFPLIVRNVEILKLSLSTAYLCQLGRYQN